MSNNDQLVEQLFNLTMSTNPVDWELYYNISKGLDIRDKIVEESLWDEEEIDNY